MVHQHIMCWTHTFSLSPATSSVSDLFVNCFSRSVTYFQFGCWIIYDAFDSAIALFKHYLSKRWISSIMNQYATLYRLVKRRLATGHSETTRNSAGNSGSEAWISLTSFQLCSSRHLFRSFKWSKIFDSFRRSISFDPFRSISIHFDRLQSSHC